VFEETRPGKSHDYRVVTLLEKLRFQNVFRPHGNAKPTFSNSSSLKSVFEKLRFRDGLVWTGGLTVETRLRFQIFRRSGRDLDDIKVCSLPLDFFENPSLHASTAVEKKKSIVLIHV